MLVIVNLVLNDFQHISVNVKSSGLTIQVLFNYFATGNHHIVLFTAIIIINI